MNLISRAIKFPSKSEFVTAKAFISLLNHRLSNLIDASVSTFTERSLAQLKRNDARLYHFHLSSSALSTLDEWTLVLSHLRLLFSSLATLFNYLQ